MISSRLSLRFLHQAARRMTGRAIFSRMQPFSTAASASKSSEQLDIDKNNGALAYVPFSSDFDITPLAGKEFLSPLNRSDQQASVESVRRKHQHDEESLRLNRDVVLFTFVLSLAHSPSAGIGGECNRCCCS